ELLLGIDKEVAAGRLPPHAGEGMKDFYANYRDAVLHSESETAHKSVVPIMATVLDRILLQFEDPFTFPPYHQSMREPFDYYKFGQEYIRPLLHFGKSYLGNKEHWDAIENQVQQGHNVVLFSNHQTEADPAIIALLLEGSHPYLAERMTYIAGDRVILDPFCKPFSMGRNLICVHSKKHINDDPELVEMKRRANTRALKELAVLLRCGKQLIWIAPSGGRDRPDPVTNEWTPAVFDPAAVDNMRRLVERGDVPGHMYPMALLSYNIMPPPPKVQKAIGERRLVGYHGVGLSVGSEVNFGQVSLAFPGTRNKRDAHQSVWESVREQYALLHKAVHGNEGPSASTPACSLSQPWLAT
ncbi:hypothetical protein SELMODRAFT_132845, partial [Selaginella moellendorffii]